MQQPCKVKCIKLSPLISHAIPIIIFKNSYEPFLKNSVPNTLNLLKFFSLRAILNCFKKLNNTTFKALETPNFENSKSGVSN